ncbi:extracellular solute-binding protein family 5 [Thermaerobacter marianensis DSM 12885]|uniref:Extracellular solute-binding protein family 5 n=1 Tax=Thermaerobacter marianensis (strain ATCC 700841 / DSM 12885 / JCM 10246 / 7p75a) TaxID=644966 RepID=E6SHV3_THEM7|nr:ABC transporter substrate-binding protein [Thermaerobacter marianensis]ADU50800.1 extracellular solute-binding protein family 5 [Thermaerobacter marianensis DSM 12885]
MRAWGHGAWGHVNPEAKAWRSAPGRRGAGLAAGREPGPETGDEAGGRPGPAPGHEPGGRRRRSGRARRPGLARAAAALLVALATLLAACGGPAGSGGAGTGAGGTGGTGAGGSSGGEAAYDPEATVTLVTPADPTFNPWHPNAYAESNVINEMIFPGLTRWDEKMRPVPHLATEWSVSDDGLVWTFKLREATWSDGQPFTADDVAFTFNEIVLNPDLGANHSSEYKAVEKVVAVDPHTVEFHLKEPFASLPSYLAYYSGILPKHIFEGVKDPWSLNEFNKKNPVGTGPFMVAEYVSGSHVRLVPNPYYWGEKPKVKAVVFRIVPDVNAQIAQLLAGEVDMLAIDDPTLLDKLQNNPNLEMERVLANVYYFVALNQDDPRFQDKRVRQALSYAIDKEAMIQSLLKGYGQVATGPIPPLQADYYNGDVARYPYDPEKAKQLLAEAGWTPGPDGILQKDGKPFRIRMTAAQMRQLVPATLLVQQWWKDLGIQVDVDVLDWNSYIEKAIVNRDYEATLAWWSTPADPDVYPYYASEAAGKGNNIPNYRNPELDDLLRRGRAATSEEERTALYAEAQRLMADELPYLYLWWPENIVVHNKALKVPPGSFAVKALYVDQWYKTR